jgi:hypothetical protein
VRSRHRVLVMAGEAELRLKVVTAVEVERRWTVAKGVVEEPRSKAGEVAEEHCWMVTAEVVERCWRVEEEVVVVQMM